MKKDISDQRYTTARRSGSGLIGREGNGRNPGSLAFEGDHRPHGGVQGGVALHDSPGDHKEMEQQESSGESVRLGRVGRTHDWVSLGLSCTWTPAYLGKAQGYIHGLWCGHMHIAPSNWSQHTHSICKGDALCGLFVTHVCPNPFAGSSKLGRVMDHVPLIESKPPGPETEVLSDASQKQVQKSGVTSPPAAVTRP